MTRRASAGNWVLRILGATALGLAARSWAAMSWPIGPKGFAVQGTSNRFVTPNGDGRNDNFIVSFSNPQFSGVAGTIYDLRGHAVASMAAPSNCPSGPSQCLMWDGRASGVVRSGVYIYVIQAETKTYTGTVVVIR